MLGLCLVSRAWYNRDSQNDKNSTAVQGENMKIKPEHFTVIEKWTLKAIQDSYSFDKFFKAVEADPEQKAKIKNPSKRYVWDMFWYGRKLSLKENCELVQVLDAVYEYANDEHIETALKKITGIKF